MDRKYILSAIKKTLDERLFWAIKKLYVQSKREKFEKIADYQNANSETRKLLLDEKYKLWYKSIDTFYLSFHSIFALVPLVKREKQIFEFDSQEMTVVKVDYKPYNGVEFSASHQTRFTSDMTKEIEDCILELSDPKYEHIIDNYKPEKDTEKTPHEPLTNATLKYNCFYLFQFEYQYTTLLATLLYNADLITNPDTNGWNIDYDVVDEIITILNSKYKEYQVLQRKRTFDTSSSVDRTQEAIRPIHYSKEYFPKNITKVKKFQNIEFENKREEEDAIKLYEFIFYITLSTQLKNSIYDTSSVDIVAGQHKLKQKAHKLIDGQDNWEILSGKYIKTIHENDNTEQGQSRVVVLPEFKSDDKIYPISVYPYTYNSRRPRRYGIGRFAAQILEKEGIGLVSQHDDIILNLIESKSLIQIQKVLNPQEIAIFFIDWISQYAPFLINIEYMKEIDEKIQSVLDGEFSLESVIGEIDRLIDESFIKANYKEDISKPSIAKINLLNSIASKYNLKLEADVYESNAKCDMVLAMYPVAEPIKVGSCPQCNSMVYQKEYIKKETGETLAYFACEKFNKSNGCTFSA